MDPDKVFQKKRGVVFRKIMDEMVLLNTRGGEVVVLNEVGGDIWDAIDGKRTFADLINYLLEIYDENRENLERDLEEFLNQLLEAGLIEEVI